MSNVYKLPAQETDAALSELASLLRIGLVCHEQLEKSEFAELRDDLTALMHVALDKVNSASRSNAMFFRNKAAKEA